jgi:hypothetical protein
MAKSERPKTSIPCLKDRPTSDPVSDGEPSLLRSGSDELMRTTPTNAIQAPGRTPDLSDDRSRCPRSTRLASSRCTKNTHPNARTTPQSRRPTEPFEGITSRACHRPTVPDYRTDGRRTR